MIIKYNNLMNNWATVCITKKFTSSALHCHSNWSISSFLHIAECNYDIARSL